MRRDVWMNYAFKWRIYPTNAQIKDFEEKCNIGRMIWNTYLTAILGMYDLYIASGGKHKDFKNLYRPTMDGIIREKRTKTGEWKWMLSMTKKEICGVLDDCDTAVKRFVQGISGRPRFKTKDTNPVNSIRLRNDSFNFNDTHVYVSKKIRYRVRFSEDYDYQSYIPTDLAKRAGLRMTRENDRFYIVGYYKRPSLNIYPSYQYKPHGNGTLGVRITMGITNMLNLQISDGTVYPIQRPEDMPRFDKYSKRVNRISYLKATIKEKHLRRFNELKKQNPAAFGTDWNQHYKRLWAMAYKTCTIQKLSKSLDREYYRQKCFIREYARLFIADLIKKLKPAWVVLGPFELSEMLNNESIFPHFKQKIILSNYSEFRNELIQKANYYGLKIFGPKPKGKLTQAKLANVCPACGEISKDSHVAKKNFVCKNKLCVEYNREHPTEENIVENFAKYGVDHFELLTPHLSSESEYATRYSKYGKV